MDGPIRGHVITLGQSEASMRGHVITLGQSEAREEEVNREIFRTVTKLANLLRK